ncbi:MAG: oligosaccharide flippase family protein [Burkholderiaceae bacterium]
MSAESLLRMILPAPLSSRILGSPLAKRLVSGSLWSLAGSATSRILVLIAMVLAARALGPTSFGEFGLIQGALGVAGLMAGLGLGGTATRFVAQHVNTDPRQAGQIIALVTLVSRCMVVAVSCAIVAASPYIAQTVLAAPGLGRAVAVGAALLLAMTLRGIQSGVLAGLERFNLIAKLNVLEGALSLVAVVVLARWLGVEGALLGLTFSSAVTWMIGRRLLADALKERAISVSYVGCAQHVRILTGYSIPSLMANLVATPVLWFAMVLLARTEHGYASLGSYHAAYQWHGPIMFIPMVLMSVSIPVLVQEWEAGRLYRFRKVIWGMCGATLMITLPVVIPAALASSWIMSLYGPGFENNWLILVLLLAAAPLHALAKIASSALLGMNRAWSVLWANLAWGATLSAISVWLIPVHGAVGLSIAFVTAYAVLAMAAFVFVMLGARMARSFSPPTEESGQT